MKVCRNKENYLLYPHYPSLSGTLLVPPPNTDRAIFLMIQIKLSRFAVSYPLLVFLPEFVSRSNSTTEYVTILCKSQCSTGICIIWFCGSKMSLTTVLKLNFHLMFLCLGDYFCTHAGKTKITNNAFRYFYLTSYYIYHCYFNGQVF